MQKMKRGESSEREQVTTKPEDNRSMPSKF